MRTAPGAIHFAALSNMVDERQGHTCPEHVSFCTQIKNEAFISEMNAHHKDEHIHQTLSPSNNITPPDDMLEANSLSSELLRWNYHLGHISFRKLKVFTHLNLIPHKLLNATPPKCSGCLYGAMTKKPWITKGVQNTHKILPAKAPG